MKVYQITIVIAFILIGSLSMPAQTRSNTGYKYTEKYRPQYHFSPAKDWMNDPNGLVYYENQYHLFYQYDPTDQIKHHVVWGHAISKDLVHWKELPIAISGEPGVLPASGSAVVDWKNSSGFGKNRRPSLVAFYCGVKGGELRIYLAYSDDNGVNWHEYKGNPVVDDPENLRDPKIIWYAPEKKWIMVISGVYKVRFYESRDLRVWKYLTEFGGLGMAGGSWECPDLFPLEVDGNPSEVKWVLVVGLTSPHGVSGDMGVQYFIGDFDGRKFTPEKSSGDFSHWADFGRDFYAVQSFSDIPVSDGRRIWIGWMSNWLYAGKVPTTPWKGAQSIPRSLSLRTFPDGIRLVQEPVAELKRLRESPHYFHDISPTQLDSLVQKENLGGNSLEIEATLEPGSADKFGFDVRKGKDQRTAIGFDAKNHDYFIDRSLSGETSFSNRFDGIQTASSDLNTGDIHLHIFVDWSSVEVFAEDGRIVLTDLIFPSKNSSGLDFFSNNGAARIKELKVWKMRSAWH